jgi:ABC-2 type transport system permease protein
MMQFLFFVRKEFLHVWRDKRTMLILFGMPIMQILIFGFALTNEVKNTRIGILDNSKDETTSAIIHQLEASRYFDVVENISDNSKLVPSFQSGDIKMAVVFPENFQEQLNHTNKVAIQLIGDATDPNTANTLINYATAVILDYQSGIRNSPEIPYLINTETRMLYNPQLKGSYNFVPGVMAMVLMLVCAMMTSISIVREKEMGTMEIILVSPIVPIRVIIAKMVPYFLLSAVNIAIHFIIERLCIRCTYSWKFNFVSCRVFDVYGYRIGARLVNFFHLQLTRGCHVNFFDGPFSSHYYAEWFYVSDRKHAHRASSIF